MFSYLNTNWSLGRRMVLIALSGFIPIVVSMSLMIKAQWQTITVAENELNGLRLQEAIWADVRGSASSRTALTGLADDFRALGAEAGLKAYLDAQGPVNKASTARDLLHSVAGLSELALDPEATSYYLMDIISLRLPNILRAEVDLQASIDAASGSQETNKTLVSLVVIQHKVGEVLASAEQIKRYDSDGQNISKLSSHIKAFSDLHTQLTGTIASPSAISAQMATDFARATTEAVFSFEDSGTAILRGLLDARISRSQSDILHYVLGTLIALAIGGFLCFIIVRDFSSCLRQQLAAIDKISHEDEDADVRFLDYRNENGELAHAISRLKAGVIERKRLSEETKRQADERSASNDYYVREHERFMETFHLASDKLSSGQFSHRMTDKVIDEYTPIVEEMNRVFERLDKVQSQISESDRQRDTVIAAFGQSLARLAAGDLRTRIDIPVSEQFERLKADFNNALEQLDATISDVKLGTDAIKVGTDEISQASDDLSRRTEGQAASLEETAAAVTEITGTVKKTADGAREAHSVVSEAKKDAEKSGEIVSRAISAMSAIESSSKKISQIIGVIDEIAFQTNLLALNAGVEGARAGDAGRGFAVVASEVRALAQRSAEAAKEIKGLISASTTQVAQGVELVGETGQSLSRIVDRVSQINSVVSQIAASASEQANGLTQINTAVAQMDQSTQQNAAMAEEATAATRTLQQQTEALVRLVSRFTMKQDGRVAPKRDHALAPNRPTLNPVRPSAGPRSQRRATGTTGMASFDSSAASANWEEF